MNKRQAMREARRMVADTVYGMAEQTGPASLPLPDADRKRVQNALLLIANRLDDEFVPPKLVRPPDSEPGCAVRVTSCPRI